MNSEQSYYRANICIKSKIISATDITKLLKTQPTKFHEKGTPINTRNFNSRLREESVWILDSEVIEEEVLSTHIEQLLSFIEKHINEFNELTKACEVEIFCGFFSDGNNGEVSLCSSLVKRLTIIPVDIVINFYSLVRSPIL
jgi:hypothetical protein